MTEEASGVFAAARLGGRVRTYPTPSRPTSARGGATASSRSTSATASGPTCTAPQRAELGRRRSRPRLVAGLALAVEPMVTLGAIETTSSTTSGPWSPGRELVGALRAHVHADPDGAWCSPPSTAASRRSATWASRTADTDPGRLVTRLSRMGRWARWRGVFPRGGVVSTARTLVRPGRRRLDLGGAQGPARAEETSPGETISSSYARRTPTHTATPEERARQ